MAVDHCFSIRGQGTVITGTILQGALRVNDTLEIPALKVHAHTHNAHLYWGSHSFYNLRKRHSSWIQISRGPLCLKAGLPETIVK